MSNHVKTKKMKPAVSPPPKRNLSAYFIFTNEQRPILQDKNPYKKLTEISKDIAFLYKGLTEAEKRPYQELAARDKERYEREKAEYLRTHGSFPPKTKEKSTSKKEKGGSKEAKKGAKKIKKISLKKW